MRSFSLSSLTVLAVVALSVGSGCAGAHAVIEPGHAGLRFDPKGGGLQHEVLRPGYHSLSCGIFQSVCPRVDDFDVTYSTKKEDIVTNSSEGLALTLRLAIVYKPIVAELYQLDTEIGPQYYEEVIGPEFRSAARGVFAHHSYLDLQKKNEKIENEIESEVRRRAQGKHVEISSVLLESVSYAPEIATAVRQRLVGKEEADRANAAQENEAKRAKRTLEIAAEQRKLTLEAEAAQRKLALETEAEQARMKLTSEKEQQMLKLQAEAEQKRLEIALTTETEKHRLESALRTKKNERELAREQAIIDRMKAEGDAAAHVVTARGEADARMALARASGEEKKAEASALTPLHVMMHAYDALAHLGGSGTTIMLGDWSKVPSFLFPRVPAFNSAFTLPWSPYGAPAPQPHPTSAPSASAGAGAGEAVLSSTARP